MARFGHGDFPAPLDYNSALMPRFLREEPDLAIRIYSGRCIRPSSQPMPSATMAVV
jgi:hypothetical protein